MYMNIIIDSNIILTHCFKIALYLENFINLSNATIAVTVLSELIYEFMELKSLKDRLNIV